MARFAFRSKIGVALTAAVALVCSLPGAASAAPGQVDIHFGILVNGTVIADHGRHDSIVKVLRQTDGKIVTVANATHANLDPAFVVRRFLANGQPDTSFRGNGVFTGELPGLGAVSDAALQSDGKIVVVGWGDPPTDFFITRIRTDGTPDPTFTPAHPTTSFGSTVDEAFAVALAPGGKIVVAGRAGANTALARFTSTGALDSTFSGDGLTTHDFGGQSEADDVAVLSNGRIIVTGREATTGGASRVVLARFATNGTLDASFGSGGRVNPTSTAITSANSVLLQGTKLVIAGGVNLSTAALARYNANGTIDATFGSGGTTRATVGKFLVFNNVIADASGRLVAVGQSANQDNFPDVHSVVTVFRFSANGARDTTFGCSGSVFTEALSDGGSTYYNRSLALSAAASGNDIVAGGLASNFDGTDFPPSDDLLVRYLGDPPASSGYALLRGDGGTSAFGGAPACGSIAGSPLHRPVVGMAFDPTGRGNWTVASDGGIFSFGAAKFFGSTGAIHLNQPIVGMAAAKDGKGYWLVASDGGIFAFGSAHFYGSTGAMHLNQPVVGMAAAKDGKGYWLVASDGGIFAFGSARFSGSTGAIHLNQPIVGMAADRDGTGYWLAARDGGVFAFAAPFWGSSGSITIPDPVVGIAADPDGTGYWLGARNGGIFSFAAKFSGATGATPFALPNPRQTVAIAATP